VELLSNLAWLAVAISLWVYWLAHRRGTRSKSLLPAVGVQVMALLMVTAISLPVISITDDLHAGQLPAEVERSVRNDRHLAPAAPASIVPFALALLVFCLNSLRPRRISYIAAEQPARLQPLGHLRTLWSRPPPAAHA
jgi:hypothetical protein